MIKRITALLLALVLLVGIIPSAFAEELSTDTVPEPEADVSEEDSGVMPLASTQNSIMLFDYADNGNYTTVLNSQVTCAYKPNGTGTTRTAYIKNMGWHYARYGGVAYADDPLYCIEPWRSYAASTSGNSVDRDVTLSGSDGTTGSNVWYALPTARREAIGLILLYSNQMWDHSISVTTTRKDSNPNVPLRVATQFLIFEIVCGLRDPNTFTRNSANESGTAGDVFYNAGAASVPDFAANYNVLVSSVQAAKKIPSFTSASSGSAPTITMNGTTASVTDANGVLSNFSFLNGNGASFSKSGNSLTITQTGTISESTTFTAIRNIPSAASSTYCLWYMSGSSYQTTISLCSASTGTLNAYFKLKAVPQVGSVRLRKTTNTGANLGGWKIGLYTDEGCTKAVSGAPFTTGADGTVTVSALTPGTYYAKELPTDDSYWAFDTAVKSVKVSVGQTAEVTFSNTHFGRIEIRKTTNTGNQLGGWTFRVKDTAGNIIGDYTTDENGYARTDNLAPGRYLIMELPTEDNYWTTELGFHDVTVTAGKTAVDTWLNKEKGLVWFYKKTNTGESVEGWHITVYSDEDCTQEIGTLITNEEGRVGYYLDPGTYWAKETGDEHGRFQDEYWLIDEAVQRFEVKPHEDTEITFTNAQYGRLKITKTVEGDGSVEGWQFKVTDFDGKVLEGSPFTTDKDGIILTGNLLPGTYTVEELLPEDSFYMCKGDNPKTVTVTQGITAEVTFTNTLRPGKITLEKIDTAGEHLAGATFLLEWSAEGSLWYPVKYSEKLIRGGCSNPDLEGGTLTTGEDGMLVWGNLYPGLHYRITELKAPNGYELLKEYAFEGELPVDDLQVSLQVVNAKGFSLPETGVSTGLILRIMQLVCTAVCAALLLISYRKKSW